MVAQKRSPPSVTHLDVSMRSIKFLLCAVNFIFMLTGGLIVSVGTTIYNVHDNFADFLDSSYYLSPATLLIIVGCITFVIALLGCYGALKESTCMVLLFALSLSLVLILEFSASITAYAYRYRIVDLLEENMKRTMIQYGNNSKATDAIDFLQEAGHCCGFYQPKDWNGIYKSKYSTYDYPLSCYQYISNPRLGNTMHYKLYENGCYSKLLYVVNASTRYIITAAMMIALVQIGGIMFAMTLGRAIRKQKTEREMRKWQMRTNLINGYEPLGKNDPMTTFPVVYMNHNGVEKTITS